MSPKGKAKAASNTQAPLVRRLWTDPNLASEGLEYLLYTDTSPAGAGFRKPEGNELLQVHMTNARYETPDSFAPKLLLRARHRQPLYPWHVEEREPRTDEMLENAPWWTGLNVDQEVAALLSLASGARVRSGGPVRRIPPAGGVGLPDYLNHHVPMLPDVAWNQVMLPGLAGRSFNPLATSTLETLQVMTPEAAGTLVKAAAAYADALWYADSDPTQGWLRLVSAVETVASFVGLQDDAVEEQFRRAQPKTAKRLDEVDSPNLVAEIAELLKETSAAGAKFRGFMQKYMPAQPPRRRPAAAERQACWDWRVEDEAERQLGNRGMKDALSTIYEHRSKFLHSGRPFPPALVAATPERVNAADGGNAVWAERPPYDAIHGGGTAAAWESKDVPMYLHMFEFIVRGALMAWWAEQAEVDGGAQMLGLGDGQPSQGSA